MLSERFRPTKIAWMIGNEQSRLEMLKWLKGWKIGSKPLLLTGPPGVGKSTAIYAIAREFGFTVIEYNASDVRTRDKLREAIGPALQNSSLFGEEKLLIFLDEIDGLSGRNDYAGMDFILEFVENSMIPVAMAANQEDSQKLKKIEQKSLVVRFKPIGQDLLLIYLRAVADRAEIIVSTELLSEIARASRGDVRQALNSLQTVAGDTLVGSRTDREFMSAASAIDAILAAKTLEENLVSLRQFDSPPMSKVRSIFDCVVSAGNLSIESKSESLDLVAMADLIIGRITREQSWRLLRYVDKYLALASFGKSLKRTDSSIPWNLRIAIWNDGRVVRSILESVCSSYHVGKSTFATLYLPYFASYFKDRPQELEYFLHKNEFGDSEKRALLKLAVKM